MRIKVNLSGNFLIRYSSIFYCQQHSIGVYGGFGNRGPVVFGDLERNYIGNILEGPDAGATIDAEGVFRSTGMD